MRNTVGFRARKQSKLECYRSLGKMDFRSFIRQHAQNRKVLEIGPSYNPIIRESDGADVRVMDHAPKSELVSKYAAFGVDTAEIGEVDFVTTDLSEVASMGEKFGLVVASHVIEHTTDFIRFFLDCETLLSAGGSIALIVPDMRYSFDCFRPVSTPGNMIDAHLAGRELHLGALFDHHTYFCLNNGQMAWGPNDPNSLEFIHSSGMSRAPLDRVLATAEYEDAHEWVFTPESFRFIVSELREAKFINFGIEFFHTTLGFEFLVLLTQNAARDDRSKLEKLTAVQNELLGLTPITRAPGVIFSNTGHCHCCRTETVFDAYSTWLRDQYVCRICGSVPRQRAINYILDTCLPGWESKIVHESSASHDFVQRYCPGYSRSFYFEDIEPGQLHPNGDLCQDLQALTFEDNSIDIFVTQDVFEHILEPEKASREILRVLKPGGCHVFTAPKYDFIDESFPRISNENGELHHLHTPEYHGNPVGDGRALVTWTYGRDFEDVLAKWCGTNTTTYLIRDRQLGLDGEHLHVFVTRKSASQAA